MRTLLSALFVFGLASPLKADTTELLIVGGTESGWAAAIQAARLGVRSITIVNDIDWIGGQFSAEALGAVDENRARSGTNDLPFPRSGLFLELMNRIESFNREKYGHAQPGNTIVRTTVRASTAERLMREMLQPYIDRGQVKLIPNAIPIAAKVEDSRLRSVTFRPKSGEPFTIDAQLVIDASDWGEVIQLAKAEYEFGPDLKAKYQEPHAPTDRVAYPITDMNPITWCMVIEETDRDSLIPKPAHFDDRRYFLTTDATKTDREMLKFSHRAHRPFAPFWTANTGNNVYTSRRLVDGHGLKLKEPSGDVILLNWTIQNYPLDHLPQWVVDDLEKTVPGASKLNIVQMTREQREIIFRDAKDHALGMFYHLQTTVHDRLQGEQKERSFRRFRLTDEFGTSDHLPPKPYIRESLRLRAMYMMREQDTLNDNRIDEFASVMYHDGLFAWQFEYDFHPTGRGFLPGEGSAGPWEAFTKSGRGWGIYSDRSIFSLRSLIPLKIDGLLGAQKNLGYSSIVSSAVRLHDHGVAVGQSAGATAAVCLKHNCQPRDIPFDLNRLGEIRIALCGKESPVAMWPFRDLSSDHPAFVAANQLAVRQFLPLKRADVDFRPDADADTEWRKEIARRSLAGRPLNGLPKLPDEPMTRGQFVQKWWGVIGKMVEAQPMRQKPDDFDGDTIADVDDAQPLDANNNNFMDHLEPPK